MKHLSSLKIIISSVLCLVLGISSGFSTIDEIKTWYVYLEKPSWNPPNWLFGPVWTVLYILIGISAGLVWKSENPLKRKALIVFSIQFLLNLLWSFLFFNLHFIGFAFFEIILMLLFIIFNIYWFNKVNKIAAILLIPYLIWVAFATFLNGTIWFLN